MDPVDAALDAAFPDHEVCEIGGTGPSWDEGNETGRAGVEAGDDAYLKIALDGDGTRFARERAVTAYVREQVNVPVPEVVTAVLAGDPPHLVTTPATGDPLLDRWDAAGKAGRQEFARCVGTVLARLHELHFEGHGRFTGGDEDGLEFELQPGARPARCRHRVYTGGPSVIPGSGLRRRPVGGSGGDL
jgi:hypothetical protein